MLNDYELETRATGSFDLRDKLTSARGYYTLLNDIEDYAGDDVFVVMCDIDDFRMFNDAYGENVGNELLVRIVRAMQEQFGDAHVFRYGSDEFLVVDSFGDERMLLDGLAALSQAVREIDYHGRALRITCSYGFARGHVRTHDELHEAVRFADRKMYEAKRSGKNRTVGAALENDPALVKAASGRFKLLKSYEVDELTGLANLMYFRSTLGDALQARESHPDDAPRAGTLVYFNVENFKAYNQHYGFDAGDEMLLLIAQAIEKAFPADLAARLSADQFIVLTERGRVEEGVDEVRAAFRSRQKTSSIWLRAGFYTLKDEDDDPGVVCDRAKMACDAIRGRLDMYLREYDESLREEIMWRRYVLDHFEQAIEESWIQPFYQPIVRVASGEICDVEALARWIDPERGVISPAAFIPALEDARLIHLLDLKILRTVCEDCVRLRDMGREFISPSINLSRLDFELCDIVAEVEALLEEYDLPTDTVSIEVTESTMSGNQSFLRNEVDRFRAAGFEVWVDDFGSGYSSLNVMKDYVLDLVKIDMVFLRGFEDVRESRIMLSHIISLAKELGLQTLVEGVETEEQLEFLRSIGCGRAQGYFIGRPASLKDSIADSIAGKLPVAEMRGKRDFYNAIGRVNLIRPDAGGDIDGHYLPSDVAACIIRRRNGRYEYLNTSALYAKFLQDAGIGSIAESEQAINDDNERRARFVEVIDRSAASGNWEHYTLDVAGVPLLVRMRKLAEAPEYDAIAVLSIVEPLQNEYYEQLA